MRTPTFEEFQELMDTAARHHEDDTQPVTVADFTPYLHYFDDRHFEPGTFVCKRRDGKVTDEGGMIPYKYPFANEPAYVVSNITTATMRDPSEPYDSATMVILVLINGEPRRFAVDPVHFERYELPGERMMREIEEEKK